LLFFPFQDTYENFETWGEIPGHRGNGALDAAGPRVLKKGSKKPFPEKNDRPPKVSMGAKG